MAEKANEVKANEVEVTKIAQLPAISGYAVAGA